MKFDDQSYRIIGCAMEVHRKLGPGLREKPYENALVIALRKEGLQPQQQRAYPIFYHEHIVGDCIPDISVGDLIVEVKSVDQLGDNEKAQALNYLRISGRELALVINFKNFSLTWERVVRSK